MSTKNNDIKDLYLEELNEVKDYSRDERLKIIDDVYKDKEKAAETLPILFLKDVVDIARLYEGQGVYSDDLIGEGNVALILGARNLDLCESAEEVEEFLTNSIMDSMEKLISEQSSEEDIDSKITEQVNRVYEAAKEMSETLLRKVTVSELAKEMDVDESTVSEALRLSGNQIDFVEEDLNEIE